MRITTQIATVDRFTNEGSALRITSEPEFCSCRFHDRSSAAGMKVIAIT